MRKKLLNFSVLLFAFTLTILFSGCSAQSNGDSSQGIQNLKFISGPTGTTWYSQASAFAGIASKKLGMNVDVLTGSAISNVIQVENGKADIGLTFSSYLPAIAEGKVVATIGDKEYFDKPTENVRMLCNTTTAGYVILVDANSPYHTISDLKDKKIRFVTYPPGFTARYALEKILEAHGITLQSIEDAGGSVIIVKKYQEACDLLAKGKADAICYTMAVNAQSAALQELESQRKFRILKLEQDAVDKITSEIPLTLATVPKGLHSSITEDTQVLADVTIWLVRKDMPGETVEQILDGILNNMDTMANVGNSEFKGFTAKDLLKFKETKLPLHPAAVKYFQEKGVL